MSGHRESLPSVPLYQQHIPRKNKRRKTLETVIIRKETIQETFNSRKMEKEDSIHDAEKLVKKRTRLFFHKVDYKGDTNEKTHG